MVGCPLGGDDASTASSTATSTPQNPRTANRELPSGKLSVSFAWIFLFVSVGGFLIAAYSLNWLTFALSPVALLSVLGYSYAKRFTAFAHLLLGWALAISPTPRGSRFAARSIRRSRSCFRCSC